MTPRTIVSFRLFAFLLTFLLPLPSFAKDPATIVRVVDGDTLEVKLNDQKEKVRLIGVDTPENSSRTNSIVTLPVLGRTRRPSGHSVNRRQTSPKAW
jgi:endonuclease YncB( thermonuclease family)